MTLTKADLVKYVSEQNDFTKAHATQVVELVFDVLRKTLVSGESVKISGFGNFLVRDKKSRRGRNPQTGEAIQISARRVLTFKPSPRLKEKVNRTRKSAKKSPKVLSKKKKKIKKYSSKSKR